MPGNFTRSALVAVFRSTSVAFGPAVSAAVLAGAFPAPRFLSRAEPLADTSITAHTPISRNESSLRSFISNLLGTSLSQPAALDRVLMALITGLAAVVVVVHAVAVVPGVSHAKIETALQPVIEQALRRHRHPATVRQDLRARAHCRTSSRADCRALGSAGDGADNRAEERAAGHVLDGFLVVADAA